jgi:hypothetical protein
LARVADHRRHRGVDDHVARDVQVGDPLVGVDHRDRRASRIHRADVGLDRRALTVGQRRELGETRSAKPSFGSTPSAGDRRRVLREHALEEDRTACPKMIGSETFIIVAFMCSEKRTPFARASATSRSRKSRQLRRRLMKVPSRISPALELEDHPSARSSNRRDRRARSAPSSPRESVTETSFEEVALGHVGDVGLGIGRPRPHLVRIGPGVILDLFGSAGRSCPRGSRVHGAALHRS